MHRKRGGGDRGIALPSLWPGCSMEWIFKVTPRPPCSLGKLPDNHCKGSWVTFGAGPDGCRKSRPPPSFTSRIEPQNTQPVATACTDYATPTANERYRQQKLKSIIHHKHVRRIYRLVYRVRDLKCYRVAFMCRNLHGRSRYTFPYAGNASAVIRIPWWCSTYLGLFRPGLNVHS